MKKCGWLIGILGLVSCQNLRQEVQPQQLAAQPVKLLVACFISPQDTVLAAKVARSRPILDDGTVTSLEITNATVTLKAGSRSIVLTYHSRLRYYRASPNQFPIRAGETYQLSVQTPDGQSVEARTTVPEAVALQQVRLDSEVVLENKQVRKRFFARYIWYDRSGQPDYYQTEGTITYRCAGCAPDKTIREPVQFTGNQGLYTNQESKGGRMVSDPGYLGVSIPSNQPFFPTLFSKPLVLTADLRHINEDYYRYHLALGQQQEVESNPFAEPVPIPTNIRGGLGCFGAYSRSTLTVRLD
ncbi:DUF4249 domain-containing protein [Larkinella humicola]|uniref:DUF4249 domain-containing protein n=1 Tax=Larkinella humicola TaxID=2607654 RepID=A0A5N1JDW3_9BACT|nr:DUF4249 domain-containing protein [Larkinella humicola]KAA9353551.1 DUF4249 domain-containing protein [Larkinella humicola]